MSRNEEKIDRRVRRTRDLLGDALVALMQEKQFDSITVQEVLDRAGVGRSTFYVHYKDKDDLFLSDAEEFLEAMGGWLQRTGEQSLLAQVVAPAGRAAAARRVGRDLPRAGLERRSEGVATWRRRPDRAASARRRWRRRGSVPAS